MKKITKIILRASLVIFIISLLIELLPEIKTSVKDIVLNWSDVGEILDKFVQIMSAALIPILIFYFGKEDSDRKELEIENQKLKKEQKYREEAKILILGIQNSFEEIFKNMLDNINSPYYETTFDRHYTTQFQNYTSKIFAEKEQRILVNRILTKMNIFSEYTYRENIKYKFFIDSLMENYKTEWGNEPSHNVRSFCNVVEKLAEEFDSDLHLKRVIEILKDIDE